MQKKERSILSPEIRQAIFELGKPNMSSGKSARCYADYLRTIYSEMKPIQLAHFNLVELSGHMNKKGNMVYFKDHLQERNILYQFRSRRIILIEGAPGVGKTTFCKQFCSKKPDYHDYKVLVLLQLRDKRVTSAKSVSDLFQCPIIQEQVVKELENREGEDVTFWLEGWDELNEEMKKDSSIFLDLLHGRVLPKASIFITSRPWASKMIRESSHKPQGCCVSSWQNDLKPTLRVDQHIEIVSPPMVEIVRVIKDKLRPDIRNRFQEFVDSDPTVKAAMHTPLAANMFADVFQWSEDTDSPLPTTESQLYVAYTCTLLMQHISSHQTGDKLSCKVSSLEAVPADVEKQLLNLCRLSWDGLVRQQLTFSKDDLGGETLGLLSEVRELYGEDVSYHFIHLTLQEFLSAYHLTQQSPEEQAQLVHKYADAGRFHKVLSFYFGLTNSTVSSSTRSSLKEICTCVITSSLLQHQSMEPKKLMDSLPQYLPTRLRHSLTCSFMIHGVMLRHLTSQRKSGNADVFHWLCESDGAIKLPTSLEEIEVSSHAWTSSDYYALGCSIAQSSLQWSLCFEGAMMGDEGMEMLCRGLASDLLIARKGAQIMSANFRSNSLTAAGVKWLMNVPIHMLQSITTLDLAANQLDRKAAIAFSKVIPRLSNLKKLFLTVNPIGGGGVMELLGCLCHHKTPLNTLYFMSIRQDNSDLPFPSLSSDPLPHSSLETLRLDNCRLSEANISLLASILHQSLWQLKELIIRDCGITEDGAIQITRAVTDNHSLTELDMFINCIGDPGAVALGEMLKHNTQLTSLKIGRCGIGPEGCFQIVSALTQNTTLRLLWMGSNTIGEEAAKLMGEILGQNESLQDLHMEFDSSLGGGANTVISSLQNNKTLRSLYLSRRYRQSPSDSRIRWY